MELYEALKNRRAIREYTTDPVSNKDIRALIDIAVQAPSAMNLQPWAFAVIEGRDRLHQLSQRIRPFVIDRLPANSPLAAHLADPQFEIFHWAPALIMICAKNEEPQSAEDCCLAAENLMLAAHAVELGTCWIGLSRPWLNQASIKQELGIRPDLVIIAPIIVGHPQQQPLPTPRERAEIIWCK